ncbi:hypothetical protein TSAR_008632, partial [Trichomalopsis sarcophagae]
CGHNLFNFCVFFEYKFWCYTIISKRLLSIGLKISVRTPLVIARCQIYFGLNPAFIRRMMTHPKIAKNRFLARTRILCILQKRFVEKL